MAIASGVNLQKLTTITSFVAQSFIHSGTPVEPPPEIDATRQVIHLAETLQQPNTSFTHFSPIANAVIEAIPEGQRLIVEAPRHAPKPAQSFLHPAPIANDLDVHGGLHVQSGGHAPYVPVSVMQGPVLVVVPPQDPPEGKHLVWQAEFPSLVPASYTHFDPIPDLPPQPLPEGRSVFSFAEPIPPAHIWLHDTVPPEDVLADLFTTSGTKIQSAGHVLTQGYAVLSVGLLPSIQSTTRYVAVTQQETLSESVPWSFITSGLNTLDLELRRYRWYDNDSADEDATTAFAPEDSAYTIATLDVSQHLRIGITNKSGLTAADAFLLQYQVNTGGFFDVNPSSTNVQSVDGLPTDGASTSRRLSITQSNFIAGQYEDSAGQQSGVSLVGVSDTELVYSILFRSADLSAGDQITFRLLHDGAVIPSANIPTAFMIGPPLPPGLFSFAPVPQIPPVSSYRPPITFFEPFATHFRWYDNSNADVDATTALFGEDIGLTVTNDFDTERHLRIAISNLGGAERVMDWQLQVSINSGVWADVDTGSDSVRTVAGSPVDDDPASQRLTARQSNYNDGRFDDNGIIAAFTLDSITDTELVYCLEFRSGDLSDNDTLRFRVLLRATGFDDRIVVNLQTPNAFIQISLPDRVVTVAAEDNVLIVDADPTKCGALLVDTVTIAEEDDTVLVTAEDNVVTVT